MVNLTVDGNPVRGEDGKPMAFADETAAHAYALAHLHLLREATARANFKKSVKERTPLPCIAIVPAV